MLLVVRVQDINDNAPSIRINTVPTLSSSNAIRDGVGPIPNPQPEVLEGSDVGTFVAHVSVEDADAGVNGRFQCEILDSSFFALRQLYPSEFKVVTAAKFDRELRDSYEFSLACRDDGLPALMSVTTVLVVVVDRNDHAPTFTRQDYLVTVYENNKVGTSIGHVTATDHDSSANGRVHYRMGEKDLNAYADVIDVNRASGVIVAKVSFDHEKSAGFSFDVVAYDGGESPRSSTARVRVAVRDVDDEEGKFTEASYSFVVNENQPAGVEVGVVSALDGDEPPFNSVAYSIRKSSVGLCYLSMQTS